MVEELLLNLEEEIEEDDGDTQRGKYMTFRCSEEVYGIGISYVDEIVGIQRITEVPETEDYIRGLINLRGKIIPVIDVRIRFGKPPLEYNDRTCIIVISVEAVIVGLIVDSIAEVVTISDEDVIKPGSIRKGNDRNQFVYGIGKVGNEVKLLVDPAKLINETEI